jgi:hypothetical protein
MSSKCANLVDMNAHTGYLASAALEADCNIEMILGPLDEELNPTLYIRASALAALCTRHGAPA